MTFRVRNCFNTIKQPPGPVWSLSPRGFGELIITLWAAPPSRAACRSYYVTEGLGGGGSSLKDWEGLFFVESLRGSKTNPVTRYEEAQEFSVS